MVEYDPDHANSTRVEAAEWITHIMKKLLFRMAYQDSCSSLSNLRNSAMLADLALLCKCLAFKFSG